jgi:hypothetical protein
MLLNGTTTDNTIVVSPEKKTLGFICLPQAQNNCIVLLNPVLQYGGLAASWEPS